MKRKINYFSFIILSVFILVVLFIFKSSNIFLVTEKNVPAFTTTETHLENIEEDNGTYIFTSNEVSPMLTSLGFGRSSHNGYYFNEDNTLMPLISSGDSCCKQGLHLGTISCWNGELSAYKNLDFYIDIFNLTPDFEIALVEVLKLIFPTSYDEFFNYINNNSFSVEEIKYFDNRMVKFTPPYTGIVSIEIYGIKQ